MAFDAFAVLVAKGAILETFAVFFYAEGFAAGTAFECFGSIQADDLIGHCCAARTIRFAIL